MVEYLKTSIVVLLCLGLVGCSQLSSSSEGEVDPADLPWVEEQRFSEFSVASLAFTSDGSVLVHNGRPGATGWELESETAWTFADDASGILEVATGPNGLIAAAGYEEVQVWDGFEGELVQRIVIPPVADGTLLTREMAFGPDGSLIAVIYETDPVSADSGFFDFSVGVWDVVSGEQVQSIQLDASSVVGVRFFPDGERVVTGADDGTARVWDVETGEQLQVFEFPEGYPNFVALSPDGKLLAGPADGEVWVWDVESGMIVQQLAVEPELDGSGEPKTRLGFSIEFSPDGKQVLDGADSSSVLWDVESGDVIQRFEGDWIHEAGFSPDGTRIAIAENDGDLIVYKRNPK